MQKKLVLLMAVLVFALGLLVAYKPKDKEVIAENASCTPMDLTGDLELGAKTAFFEGQEISIPSLALNQDKNAVLGTTSGNKWIEVDLSDQVLKAWEGDRIFMETKISSGLPGTPTPKGEFNIWIKLRATKMSGGSGRNYYYLPNVPYVMFFQNSQVPGRRGYGLHGTYWHSDFGNPRSHGCVNLPTERAKELYYWVTPNLPNGSGSIRASGDNPGTKIVIHD